jgi:ketosteroid isomerase-like protein
VRRRKEELMKFSIRAAILALLVAVPPVHAQQRLVSDTSLAALARADRAFAKLSADSTPQRAFTRFMAADGIIYRPRAVKAHEYLRSRPMHPAIALLWEPVFADVSAGGDLGYTTGPWISQRRDAPNSDPIFGQYVNIWRRQADRSWKVELHAAIAHDADSQGPGELRAGPAPEWRGRGTRQEALRSLLEADAALAKSAGSGGASTAFRSRSAPQLRLLQQGEYAATGNAALGLLRTMAVYRWQPSGGNISASGDLGYTYGAFVTATGPANASINRRGDYLRIWRRSGSGEWQVVLDIAVPM